MATKARAEARQPRYGRAAGGLATLSLVLLAVLSVDGAPPAPTAITPQAVREQQAALKEERESAVSSGLTKMFSPDWAPYRAASDRSSPNRPTRRC